MTRKPRGLQLSPAGIKAGVWIDTGQWEPIRHNNSLTDHHYGGSKVTDEPPVIMRGHDSFTEAQAREKGWLL